MGRITVGLLLTGDVNWIGGLHYVENLTRALKTLPPQDCPRLALLYPAAAKRKYVEPLLPLFDISLGVRPGSLLALAKAIRSYGLGAERELPISAVVRQEGIDIVFPVQESLGTGFPVPWLGWIPDFQHSVMPEFFGPAHRLVRRWRFLHLLRDATRVVLSSNSALQDLKVFAGERWLAKTDVLHFTCVPNETWFEISPSDALRKYDIKGPYFLVPNQFWVHKNHRDVFEAVRILKDRGRRVQVVCTGRTLDPRRPDHFPRLKDFVATHRLDDRIRILGLVPRTEQVALLRGCRAVIQPSRFEGWSTVVEEARAVGRPLILSRIPTHHEQAPPGATFFSLGDPRGLAEDMWERWKGGGDVNAGRNESMALSHHASAILEFARRFHAIAQTATA